MRNKNAQYRKKLRKEQLQNYFKQRREEIIQNQNQQSQADINQLVSQHMITANTTEIYELLYKSEPLKKLNMLNISNCLDLFKFLVFNITQLQCVLLLKCLIDVHYRLIFLNIDHWQSNMEFVSLLYQRIDEGVHELSSREDEGGKRQAMKIISGYLDCLRSLIFNKQEKEGQFAFNGAFTPELIQHLWFYLKYLHSNPIYLMILALSEIDFDMSSLPFIQQHLYSNVEIILTLMEQVDSQKTNQKYVALPSVVLVNSILKNLQAKREFVLTILPPYLQKVKLMFSNCQSKQNKNFTLIHFYDMLDNVIAFFELLSTEILPIHLGQIMSKSNFWTFSYLLLRIQVNEVRQQIYEIIKLAVKNIVVNKALLQGYITEDFVSFMVEGIESKYSQNVAPCLHTLNYLVFHAKNLPIDFFELLNQYEASNSLENLEYHSNNEIAQEASALLKYLKSIDPDSTEMALE